MRSHGLTLFIIYYWLLMFQYVGMWVKGRRDGLGELVHSAYKYEGHFRLDAPIGEGKFVFGDRFEQHGEYHSASGGAEQQHEHDAIDGALDEEGRPVKVPAPSTAWRGTHIALVK